MKVESVLHRLTLPLFILILALVLKRSCVLAIYKLELNDLPTPGMVSAAGRSKAGAETSAASSNNVITQSANVKETNSILLSKALVLGDAFSANVTEKVFNITLPSNVKSPIPTTPMDIVHKSVNNSVVLGEVIIEQKSLVHEAARVYGAKRCRGGGCPYTGSWLAHVNLYKRVGWLLSSTKMETASFNIFDRAHYKFQMADPNEYYVHHMSMFEHQLHKKSGFDIARNLTQQMSDRAFEGECALTGSSNSSHFKEKEGHLRHHGHPDYLTLIPFYGGLPPQVDADFSRVRSIGQGNSLVPASMKILQCMATACSCQRYFGHVVIGVANVDDLELVQSYLAKVSSRTRHHMHIVMFNMTKPAHLPFHLLAWGQQFVKKHNCFHQPTDKKVKVNGGSDTNVWEICEDSDDYLMSQHQGGPITVQRMVNFRPFPHIAADKAFTQYFKNVKHDGSKEKDKSDSKHLLVKPFRFVYYTEMDQILRFDSEQTLLAISAASNSSCFFTGRRKEKSRDSSPTDYMGQLTQWRECGEAGYSFTYPTDLLVRQLNAA